MRPLGSDTHKMEKENYSFDIKGFANSDAYVYMCLLLFCRNCNTLVALLLYQRAAPQKPHIRL